MEKFTTCHVSFLLQNLQRCRFACREYNFHSNLASQCKFLAVASVRDTDSVCTGLCTSVKGKPWIASGSFSPNGHGPTDCSTLRYPEFALRAVVSLWVMLVIACLIVAQRVCWIDKRWQLCFTIHLSHCTHHS